MKQPRHAADLEGLGDVAEALVELALGSLQLLQLQPAHCKHALQERAPSSHQLLCPPGVTTQPASSDPAQTPPAPIRSSVLLGAGQTVPAGGAGSDQLGWKQALVGQSHPRLCPVLTQVMAGPSRAVTGSYISRSFLRTAGLMGCISGKPRRTTSACLTGSPGKGRSEQTCQREELADIVRTPTNPTKQNPAENNRRHINGKAAEPRGGQPVAAWPKAQQNSSSWFVEAGHRHSHSGPSRCHLSLRCRGTAPRIPHTCPDTRPGTSTGTGCCLPAHLGCTRRTRGDIASPHQRAL